MKTQIWIAISVHVLVAIVRKHLEIERDLYTILQILSVCLFQQLPLAQVLTESEIVNPEEQTRNQLEFFDL